MSTCVITGCMLHVGFEGVWGDLHEEGRVWIFNAVLNREGEANFQATPIIPATSDQRILQVRDGAPYFERRGVFVIDKLFANLNPTAQEYIK